MCCWFSRTATRRISCTDQRIKATVPSVPASHRPGSGGWHGLWLLGSHCLGIQAMADCRQHGKGQHDQRDVPVPAVPRAGLIMVKSQFILRRLKSILDGPTLAIDLASRALHRRRIEPLRVTNDPGTWAAKGAGEGSKGIMTQLLDRVLEAHGGLERWR